MDGIVVAYHCLTSKQSEIKDPSGMSETFDKAYL